MPKVSIVIPTFNRAKMLCEAIESVLSQSYKDFEIIVVDDGSTDKTKDVVSKYGNTVKYVFQENAGASAARNRGIAVAKGEYIAFLDSDDLFLPNKLSLQVEALDRHTDCAMSFTHALVADTEGNQRRSFWNGNLSGTIYPQMLFIKNSFITTPTVMVRSTILRSMSGFDESMSVCEDLDLWRRIAKSYKVHQIPVALSLIRVRTHDTLNIAKDVSDRTNYYEKAFKEDTDLQNNFKRRLLSELYTHYGLLSIKHRQNHLTADLMSNAFKKSPFRLDRYFMLVAVYLLAFYRQSLRPILRST